MTWIQTASGRAVDLLAIRATDIDFVTDVAPALARCARFTGQVPKGPYSVAQHCAVGATVILQQTGNRELAALFLLHDAHEAYLGDWSRPLQLALEEAVAAEGQTNSGPGGAAIARQAFKDAVRRMKATIDVAIYAAAGIDPPRWGPNAQGVKHWDERMLETERKLFLGPGHYAWHWDANPPQVVRWPEKPVVWPWPVATDKWLTLFRQLCPAALVNAA